MFLNSVKYLDENKRTSKKENGFRQENHRY